MYSGSTKPFAGKKFYLDLKGYPNEAKLAVTLQRLGGVQEQFFHKDVSFVVSNRVPSKAQFSTPATPLTNSSFLSPQNLNDWSVDCIDTPVNSPNFADPNPIYMSRGKSMLQKAREKRQSGTSDILELCKQWNKKVYNVQKLTSWIEKFMNLYYRKHIQQKQKLKKTDSSYVHPQKITSPFLKIEDSDRTFRTRYKEFKNWTDIVSPSLSQHVSQMLKNWKKFGKVSTSSRPPLVPLESSLKLPLPSVSSNRSASFTKVKASNTSVANSMSVFGLSQMVEKENVLQSHTKKTPKDPKKKSKKPYCEICDDYYADLDVHIETKSHLLRMNNEEYFASVKEIICSLPQVDHFLASISTSNKPGETSCAEGSCIAIVEECQNSATELYSSECISASCFSPSSDLFPFLVTVCDRPVSCSLNKQLEPPVPIHCSATDDQSKASEKSRKRKRDNSFSENQGALKAVADEVVSKIQVNFSESILCTGDQSNQVSLLDAKASSNYPGNNLTPGVDHVFSMFKGQPFEKYGVTAASDLVEKSIVESNQITLNVSNALNQQAVDIYAASATAQELLNFHAEQTTVNMPEALVQLPADCSVPALDVQRTSVLLCGTSIGGEHNSINSCSRNLISDFESAAMSRHFHSATESLKPDLMKNSLGEKCLKYDPKTCYNELFEVVNLVHDIIDSISYLDCKDNLPASSSPFLQSDSAICKNSSERTKGDMHIKHINLAVFENFSEIGVNVNTLQPVPPTVLLDGDGKEKEDQFKSLQYVESQNAALVHKVNLKVEDLSNPSLSVPSTFVLESGQDSNEDVANRLQQGENVNTLLMQEVVSKVEIDAINTLMTVSSAFVSDGALWNNNMALDSKMPAGFESLKALEDFAVSMGVSASMVADLWNEENVYYVLDDAEDSQCTEPDYCGETITICSKGELCDEGECCTKIDCLEGCSIVVCSGSANCHESKDNIVAHTISCSGSIFGSADSVNVPINCTVPDSGLAFQTNLACCNELNSASVSEQPLCKAKIDQLCQQVSSKKSLVKSDVSANTVNSELKTSLASKSYLNHNKPSSEADFSSSSEKDETWSCIQEEVSALCQSIDASADCVMDLRINPERTGSQHLLMQH